MLDVGCGTGSLTLAIAESDVASIAAGESARASQFIRPMTRPGQMREGFKHVGLLDVADGALTIRMNYVDFGDWWDPIEAGEGSLGKYVTALAAPSGERLKSSLRAAYEAGAPDGPHSFAATAWVCKGTVPA